MADEVLQSYSADGINKVSEYFKIKKDLSLLRADIKDLQVQHELYEEIQKISKKIKELRDKMKEEEKIRQLSEKMKDKKERMDLLKEMIRIDLIENSQQEIKSDDKVLKLVYVVKEAKEDKSK